MTDDAPDQQLPAGPPAEEAKNGDPNIAAVQHYLLYGLSLPERMLRSTTALLGGALRESSALLVPQAFRNSKTYNVFVQQMLDFLVVDVGGVKPDPAAANAQQIENFVARKTVSNFVELAGLATLHLSPVTVLALMSDIAYGSQSYLMELSDELKRSGVIDEKSTIDNATSLLSALSQASSTTAQAFSAPPLSVEGLKETIQQTRSALSQVDPATVIPQAEIERLWNEMRAMSKREGVGLLDISSAMTMYTLNRVGDVGRGALSSVTVVGNMFERNILGHYASALVSIKEKGFYATVADSSRPYIEATWQNFSTDKTTITEDLLAGRLLGKAWSGMRAWFSRPPSPPPSAEPK